MSSAIILRLTELLYSAAAAAGVFAGFFVVFYLLERRAGGDLTRYRTRHFWNDVVYAMFYRGDFYHVLIGAALVTVLQPRLAFMQLDVFKDWSLPARAVAFWITSDFLGYWLHRLQHRVPLLWAFHSVHHAQERMTFLTSYRIHPVEQLLASSIMFVPLLVIGLPTQSWLPLVAVLTVLEFAQHSDLPWRFGPLYRVLVSPAFHAIHHSVERRHYDKHFGKILSTWDVLFGTAVGEADRPRKYGIEGLHIPESLPQQFVLPFRLAWRTLQRRPAAPPVAPSASSAVTGPSDAVLGLLKNAGATIECELHGHSMGRTLPHGTRLRVRCEHRTETTPGQVVAFIAGNKVTVHRVAARGLFGNARSYILTRGDGALLLDHPIPRSAIVGVVSEWTTGDGWRPMTTSVANDWRSYVSRIFILWPTLIALHIDRRLAMLLTAGAITVATGFRNGRRLLSGHG